MNIKCGDKSYSFESIVDKYTNMIYRLAMIRMKNIQNSEEVVQDTYLRLIEYTKKGNTFQSEEHLKAWLLRVASNRGISILNLVWNKRTIGMESIAEVAATENENNYAYEYVKKLPEKYRIVIDLFYYEELSTEQIAQIMGKKSSTIRSYLFRAREKLKNMMEADSDVE